MKITYQFTILLLCGIIISSTAINYYQPEPDEGYYVVLELEHYNPEGELLEKQVIDNDLITRQYAYMLYRGFGGLDWQEEKPFDNKDEDGTNRNYYAQSLCTIAGTQAKIAIGTGTDTPTISDYSLDTKVGEETVNDVRIWYNGNQMNLTIDTTFLIESSYSITETGLFTYVKGSLSSYYHMMMCRDTFNAISVDSGDTLTVRYVWVFNE